MISHFILDMLPHWDGGDFDRNLFNKTGMIFLGKMSIILSFFDIIICFILMTFLYKEFNSKLILIGAFAGIIPDLAKLGYATRLKRNKHFMNYLKFHSKIQKEVKWKPGLLIQIIITILLIIMIF